MSQWIELTFVPPVNVYELPTARWTVPSIFSSNATFFMKRWSAGVAADAELAQRVEQVRLDPAIQDRIGPAGE